MSIKTIEERFKQLQDKDRELFIFKFEKWIYKVYTVFLLFKYGNGGGIAQRTATKNTEK